MITINAKNTILQYGNDGYIAESPQQVLEILKEKGVAVLPNVLSKDECQKMNDGMWDTVEHLTSGLKEPVKRDDPQVIILYLNLD